MATIEIYAGAHPGPDPAHNSCGSNPPQYVCSDKSYAMRNQPSLCRPTFNEFQHVESDTRCLGDLLNRTVCQKVKHSSTHSHYTRPPPVTGEAWQMYHDMLENVASLEGWTQKESIELLTPPQSIPYPGIISHPVVITTQPSQSSIVLSGIFPKDQLVAPPPTQQVAHSEVNSSATSTLANSSATSNLLNSSTTSTLVNSCATTSITNGITVYF